MDQQLDTKSSEHSQDPDPFVFTEGEGEKNPRIQTTKPKEVDK